MRPILHGTAAAILVLVASIASAATDTPNDTATRLKQNLPTWVEKQGAGAIVFAVKDSGVWTYPAAGTPFAPGHPAVPPERVEYEIGSISKVFTGILLAYAVHEKKLALDDTLSARLPVKFAPEDTGRITLQQLATHTSCLPRLPTNLGDDANTADPYAHYDDTRLFAYLASAKIPKAPPCDPDYSNLGVGLLGVVLERAYGKPWDALIAEKITKPLGMVDTAQTLSPEQAARLAQGWNGAEKAAPWTFKSLAGAGALRSTAADMARFADALLEGENGPLKPVWTTLTDPYVDAPGIGGKLGLAIVNSDLDGEPMLTHDGGTGGFRSNLRVFPRTGVAMVALASNAHATPEQWSIAARDADHRGPAPAEVVVGARELAPYVGVYTLAPQVKLTVILVENNLRVRLTAQTFLPIFAEGKDTFFYKAVDAKLVFGRGADGHIDTVALQQNGRNQRAARSSDPVPTILFPSAKQLAEFAGEYDFGAYQPGATLTVKAVGEVLTAQLTGQGALPVHNTAPDQFEWDVVPASLSFERDAAGKVIAATLHQNGADMRSPRK